MIPDRITRARTGPGPIASGRDGDEVAARMLAPGPRRRDGSLDEVAAVRFLLSSEASSITGSDLVVSGGSV